MPHPVVVRVAKLATWGAIAASGQHTWRERETPNADPDRTQSNEDWRPVGSALGLRDAVSERLALVTEKPTARHPVKCLEYLVTANGAAFQENGGTVDSTAYFRDALAWLERKHGAANIVAVNIQRDEQAPHMVVYAVPLVDQQAKERKRSVIVGSNPDGTKKRETITVQQQAGTRLSAAHFCDGRAKLSALQTDFARDVGQRHGLERGIEGSKAHHATVREWYAAMQGASRTPSIEAGDLAPRALKSGFLGKLGYAAHRETAEGVAERINASVRQAYAPTLAAASTASQDRKRAETAEATTRDLQRRLRPVLDALRPLDAQGQADAVRLLSRAATKIKADRDAKREAEKARKLAERKAQRAHKPDRDRGR